MSVTDVLRNEEELDYFLEVIREDFGFQAVQLAYLTFQWGLRVSDLICLKWVDVEKAIQYGRLKIVESKTKKTNHIFLNSESKDFLKDMRSKRPYDIFLFQSNRSGEPRHIVRQTPSYWMNRAQDKINITFRAGDLDKVNLGTHSLRKIAARRRYDEDKNIAYAQLLLNHSSPDITISYLGLNDVDKQNVYRQGSKLFNRKKFKF